MATAKTYSATNKSKASDEDHLIGLVDIFHIVRIRWIPGFLTALVAAIALMAYFLTREDTYSAVASMTVELAPQNIMDIREVVDTKVTHVNLLNTVVNTHVERLRSEVIAELVVDSLSEEEYAAVVEGYVGPLAELPSEKREPNAASLIMRNALTVERGAEDDSQIVIVTITHPSPDVAQLLANRYVDEYIEYKASLRSETTAEAVSFLGREVEIFRDELAAEEKALQEFRQKNNIVSVQENQGVIIERLNRLSEAVTETKIGLLAAEGKVRQLHEAKAQFEGVEDSSDMSDLRQFQALMSLPFIGGREDVTEMYNELNALLRERKILDETYLRRHPKIEANQVSLESSKRNLQTLIQQVSEQVTNEYTLVQTELDELEKKVAEAEQDVLDAERAMIDFRRMNRELEKKRELLDTITTRYSETVISQKMSLNTVRPLDMARKPTAPNAASVVQMAAIAVFCGGVFLVGVPLACELLDNRLRSFADAEECANVLLLGDIRAHSKKDSKALYSAVLQKDTDLVEAFRTIFSALRLRTSIGKQPTGLVITSSLPGEGKSTVASNLAAVAARHGIRVLLADCDLRKPAIHSAFDLENDKGLLAWVDAGASLDTPPAQSDLLGLTQVGENLTVLRSGGHSEHAPEVLSSRGVADLFAKLKEEYDLILFDTPPVGLFPDATIMAGAADRTVFVARQFAVKKAKLTYASGLMDETDAPLVGLVMNGVSDPASAVGYGNRSTNYGHGYEKDDSKYRAYYSH